MNDDLAELVLNRTWRPALAVTGMDGYPMPENAGNVLLPYTTTKLSFRLPPTCEADKATSLIKKTLEADAPYGAEVEFDAEEGQGGWNAPELAPWLADSLKRASSSHFGKPVAFMGEGGSIPFMAMLGKRYPKTQFVVTGVLGPHSNAHGPNEFLHIPTAKKVSACIADVIAPKGRFSAARIGAAVSLARPICRPYIPPRTGMGFGSWLVLPIDSMGWTGRRLSRARTPSLERGTLEWRK
jgi:hypothetical protein